MAKRRKYRRRPGTPVVAIQLSLDTGGFTYQKWGGTQRCKEGDWIVKNGDDIYTVDSEVFARTYRRVSEGLYEKTGNVWAEEADTNGTIPTKEGSTDYVAGDYLVFNDEQGADGYAISRDRFHSLYEVDE